MSMNKSRTGVEWKQDVHHCLSRVLFMGPEVILYCRLTGVYPVQSELTRITRFRKFIIYKLYGDVHLTLR